jgi:transketolase
MIAADQKILQTVANTIRVLSAEAIEKADCGHPGLPLGCAEMGAYLFGKLLRHNPKNPKWMGRDRFVLSAGHGSMFLYSLLHLSGYDLSLEQLKNFRQLHSQTPGHPEYGEAPGVETTTGPLGQGIAAATGMAIAQKLLAARFGADLFNAKIWALAGDGCLMEGISGEASSLAGHLQLGNLVIIYDSNDICLDGPTSECFTEDTAKRYEAYGWRVLTINGHDFDAIEQAFTAARAEQARPTLIVAKTIIGKGAPKKQGTNGVHGAKLGAEELAGLKKNLGWPEEAFYVPQEVRDWFAAQATTFAGYEAEWDKQVAALKANPEQAKLWDTFYNMELPADFDEAIWNMTVEPNKATRSQSQVVLTRVAELAPFFFSGSADLSGSDNTAIKGAKAVTPTDFNERIIKFGVREFAMAAASYGMALHGMVQPLCGTFFTFSDYMKNAIRLSALMKVRSFYQFTHDSILLGEDGPTHQPVEHLAALRAMPNMSVVRPADENELKAAWIHMFKHNGPTALVLSRQNIKSQGDLSRTGAREGVARGGYVLYGETGRCDVLLVSTGAEIGLAMDVAKQLEAQGKSVRVVSLPCWAWFDAQGAEYRQSVLGGEVTLKVSIEAAATMGWHKYIGSDGLAIGVDSFGASAPAKELARVYGFTAEQIIEKINAALPVTA